ncbi:hypothetical protein [Streptomyces sp. NBC_00658]|uniref:hypothetical protein n=1 Tax=Streptomyces sp. NBC_00658 TaxID=2975800 RepID=UPI0032516681
MSDSSGRTPEGLGAPDFLDRLIARHALGAAPRPGVVRVRPHLAGPFERVEAVRTGVSDAEEPVWPTAPQVPSDNDGLAVRPTSREVHFRTEREQTVVRTERAPGPTPSTSRQAEREAPVVPLLRPAATVTPGLRPAPEAGRRSARTRAGVPAAQSAASVPTPPGTDVASTAVSSPLRPSAADTAAARDAVRQVAGRRAGRGAEQVVQVQIGRLEVTAAPSPSAGGRTQSPAVRRPGAAVSLEEYLARGRE